MVRNRRILARLTAGLAAAVHELMDIGVMAHRATATTTTNLARVATMIAATADLRRAALIVATMAI